MTLVDYVTLQDQFSWSRADVIKAGQQLAVEYYLYQYHEPLVARLCEELHVDGVSIYTFALYTDSPQETK